MPRRILVVEDEPLVCDSIRRVLELDKHEVKTAANAEEALVAFQNGHFDVVIVDYRMPEMNGDKLAAAIKALAPQQPVIMITAYAESLRLAGAFPLAVDLVISKPFGLDALRAAIRQVAAKR